MQPSLLSSVSLFFLLVRVCSEVTVTSTPPLVMFSVVPQMVPGADDIVSRGHLDCQQSSPTSEYEERQMLRPVAQVMRA